MLSKAEAIAFDDDHGVYGSPGDLTPWDVRFDPSDRAHLDAVDDVTFRFRVWADPDLGDGMVVIRHGDQVSGYPMEAAASTGRFTFWEAVVVPLEIGSEYSFAFRTPEGRGVYLVPAGVTNAVERLDRWTLETLSPLSVPDWARGAVIYQVFPDRFAASGRWEGGPLDPWGSTPTPTGFQGGDLAGITERLGYLEGLGVDAIYLNPIFCSPSNHRYDTFDYMSVDPKLGGNDALRELVDAAHRRGMRVILDASFNHVHPRFFAFQDVIANGPDSDFWNWFQIDDWPLTVSYREDNAETDPALAEYVARLGDELGLPLVPRRDGWPDVTPSYQAWYGVPTMPRVDLSNPDARSYMLEVAAHWPREYGVEGWRMDVVRYIDPDFWDDFRKVVREVRPDIFLLSEVMGDAGVWLQGGRFDATMNYTFRDLCLRFFAQGELTGEEMIDGLSRLWAQYAWPVTLASHNLIGSHDTARFLTEAGGDVWRLRLATVLQLTYPGAPGIYYGDEIEMTGGEEPASRGAFDWDTDPESHEVFRTIRDLARLRNSEPALKVGDWRPVAGQEEMFAFERTFDGRRLVVLLNRSDALQTVAVGPVAEVLWGDGVLHGESVEVPPHSAVVIA